MPHEQRVEALIASFRREFGRAPEGIAEAPGRVNLIGEHVDYNDGLVLPFAINRSVLAAFASRDDDVVRAYSVEYDEQVHLSADGARSAGWAAYVGAVLAALRDEGYSLGGMELAVTGDVPQGSGLSSSAAVEVAVAGAFRLARSLDLDSARLAQLCQRAENEFVGVQCGIMDQFASALSQRDCALLIDCRSLAYEAVPLRLADAGLAVVIANSGASRELAGSAYNQRRRECEQAVLVLRERLGRPDLASLRDVPLNELEQALSSQVPPLRGAAGARGSGGEMLRRARHVVTEIARVCAAVDALRHDDFVTLGQLMQESHLSLRDDYEVSSAELDLLVGLATAQEYVAGARLTGAGFGGCTVNLVRADAVDAFERDVIVPYRQRTGLPAETYVTGACDGLRAWRL